MKWNRYILIVLLAIVGMSHTYAQKVLTGNVVEIIDGKKEPIYGANVVVVNRSDRYLGGVITDFDGNYHLSVPNESGLRIRISYIGMRTETFDYKGQSRLDVTLRSESSALQEVQITAKRIERDDMGVSFIEQTSATQKVNMAEIVETTPVSSIEEALQGQLAGVDIVMGGDPGSRSAIRIRGVSSLNGSSEPLIVIDGVPYSTEISDDFNFSTANEEDFGALLNIAPSDIESIEVLKDASATAIWGTKGANGVLLVNTKKGTRGKTNFSFSTKFTYNFEPDPIPLLDGDQYVAMIQDAIWNAANAKGLTSASTEMDLLFNTPEINYVPEWQYFDEYNTSTNWFDLVRQDAYTSDNNFALSGGGEKATYRFSLGYMNQMGTTIGTNLNRINSKLNIAYDFSDRLKVTTDFSFTQSDKEGNAMDNVRAAAQAKMPNKSPYYINDVTGEYLPSYFSRQEEDFQGAFDGKNKNYNPLAMANEGFNNTMQRDTKISIKARYTFPFGLLYDGYVSMNMKTTKSRSFLPQEATGVLWTSTYANRSTDKMSDNLLLQTEHKLIYNKTFNDVHSVLATGVFRANQGESYSYTSGTYGNASPGLSDPVVGSAWQVIGSGYSKTRSISLLGQFIYTYDRRYVAKATLNREGNSAMGKARRFATFPAFGLAWNFSEEHFFDDSEWMTDGKLRASLGWSGKAPSGASAYLGAYSTLGDYMNMSAIYPIRIQLDKLKWETKKEWNFGFDLRLFDRLGVTVDYYDGYVTDLLLKDVKVPSTTGYTEIKYYNSGELRNKGLEVHMNYDIIKNETWKLTTNLNISTNENMVMKLPVNMVQENYSFKNSNYAIRVVEGDPIGSFYGYRYKGVYQNTEETYARDAEGNVMYDHRGDVITMKNGNTQVFAGDAKYEDINYDGVINEYDIVYLGNSNPKFQGGGGFTLSYKKWSLTAFLFGRLGQKVINQARMDLENMYGTANQSTAVLSRWRAEGDDTDIPRALYGMGYNYLGSDRFVEDASFIRLKQLTLNYSVPKDILKKANINQLSVFCTAYNLFTWTKYSGQDPEVSLPSSATSLVKDGSTTPVTKRVSLGININF